MLRNRRSWTATAPTLLLVMLALVVGLHGNATPADATPTRSPNCRWVSTPFPQVRMSDSHGFKIAAVSAADAWAVGTIWPGFPTPTQPLILRWDGRRWTRVRAPHAPHVQIHDAAAASRTRAWAVGGNGNVGGTVALMWNGKVWRRVPTPNDPRSSNNKLDRIYVAGPNDVWATGSVSRSDDSARFPLVQHWDGRRWKIISGFSGQAILTDIDGSSPSDIWIVGMRRPRANNLLVWRAVAFHWNGVRWREQPLPRAALISSGLDDVGVVSPNEAWAVGATDTAPDRGESGRSLRYNVRWDGRHWTTSNALRGGKLYVDPHHRLWAASGGQLLRRDRGAWRTTLTPLNGRSQAGIVSIGKSRTGPLWISGTYWDARRQKTQDVLARYSCR